MVANAATQVKDVKDLVAQLKAKPDRYVYATAGNGTAPHFAGELFKLNAGVQMTDVPYKGSAPALNDTLGGQTQFMFPSLFSALPHIKGGKLKALAIAGPKRSPLLPDVPTMKEAGVDGVEVQQWYGVFAPAKTPKDVVAKLNKVINDVLNDKDVIKRMEDHGADVETSTPEQLGSLVKSELVKWKSVVAKAKIVGGLNPPRRFPPTIHQRHVPLHPLRPDGAPAPRAGRSSWATGYPKATRRATRR